MLNVYGASFFISGIIMLEMRSIRLRGQILLLAPVGNASGGFLKVTPSATAAAGLLDPVARVEKTCAY